MILIESTPHCGAVAPILFALAELGLEPTFHTRAEGAFLAEDGEVGPALTIDGTRVVGLPACMRLLVERFAPALTDGLARLMTGPMLEVALGLRDWVETRHEPARASEAKSTVERALDRAEPAQGERPWLLEEAGPLDGMALILVRVSMADIALAPGWPRLANLAARLSARPAFARAMQWRARLAAAEVVEPAQVLDFWFGAPARTEADFEAKARRWFLDGSALDDAIRERFGVTVDQALVGGLDDWAHDPRGRLALILVLDQLPRHVFRGNPRAYAGDLRAQALCLEGLERGTMAHLDTEGRIFFSLPLTHAEDVALQERVVALRRDDLGRASPPLRPWLEIGLEQAAKHRDWIRRFGRFPHRNEILGRPSTAEERAFMQTFAQVAAPRRYTGSRSVAG